MTNGNTIINPLKVFISSGCGKGKERYNEIRKNLKEKIENTRFAKVYLFEEDGRASTQTAEQIYLRELDDSCVFRAHPDTDSGSIRTV